MGLFPPLPLWEASHPVLVHVPIGVLVVVPVLVVASMLFQRSFRALGVGVLILLAIGTGGLVLAAMSGDAAEHSAQARQLVPRGVGKLIHEHEELGELSRNLFLGLTGVYALLIAGSLLLGERITRFTWNIASGVFLLLYVAPVVVLMNAGGLGGHLVHEHGVRADLRSVP